MVHAAVPRHRSGTVRVDCHSVYFTALSVQVARVCSSWGDDEDMVLNCLVFAVFFVLCINSTGNNVYIVVKK